MQDLEQKSDVHLIGVDIGVNTGIALAVGGKLKEVFSTTILEAMDYVRSHKPNVKLYIEDARKLKWGGYNKGNTQRLQGAGSVKRDAQIWEEFAIREGIDYLLIDPRSNRKKLNAEQFKKLTGYEGSTNEHGRDAGMLVVGRKR